MADKDYLPSGLPLEMDAAALEGLSLYLDQLVAWNKVLNLSAFNNRQKIIQELIADSFYLADFLENLFGKDACPQTADLGSGAGLPGIPLRLVWSAGRYTLVEAREKRALFLANVLSRLKLTRTYVFRGMAEKFFQSLDKNLDCIVSRAFMPWPKLGVFCRPRLSGAGFLIVMANQPPPKDADGWGLARDYSYPIGERTRYFWAMRKDGA